MITTSDWPELDRDGNLARDVPWSWRVTALLPPVLEDWLRAAGGAAGGSCVIRLALLAYLTAHFPELRPEGTR